MIRLNVWIEIEATEHLAGTIEGNSTADASFRYAAEYIGRSGASPISLSLPLREEPFSPSATKNYFDGLLPEGFTRRSVAGWIHSDENDYLSILRALGRECIGAVRISDEGEARMPSEAAYERLSTEELSALAAEGAARSSELVTKSHLSLAGASGKAGVYRDPGTGDWYLPLGTAPSTHIIKQSHVRLDQIVTNEQLVLMTARRLGIDTAESFIINTGSAAESEVLLASGRYDRAFAEHPPFISGLPRPARLHQEDFAQAMGIPSSEKYEGAGSSYIRDMFEILRTEAADPIADQLKLWDTIVFNWLAGNTDAHIKNSSLLYSSDMKTLSLAPAYDMISTSVYDSSTRNMSMRIGSEISLDRINRNEFEAAAVEAGLGKRVALSRFDRLAEDFIPALKSAAEELEDLGFHKANSLSNRILQSGGIAGCRR